jgi:hypothetical protein
MNKISIYLAGSIKKGHENPDESFWTDQDMECLRDHLAPCKVLFLNPAFRSDDLSDNQSVFGRDMLQVFSSQIVLVDARARRGLGVGAEMMWAKVNRIPVIAWAPQGTHYSKTQTTVLGVTINNFVHPFVDCLSDTIVQNLEEAANWIQTYLSNKSIRIKDLSDIHGAINYYKAHQLEKDIPAMKELFL